MNEITLDNKSNIKKVVLNNREAILKDEEYSYGMLENHGFQFGSIRKNGIKIYTRHLNDFTDIFDHVPNIVLNNHKIGIYAELKNGSTLISREWYMAFNTRKDFEAVYESLGHDIPIGFYYDLLNSDVGAYKYCGLPDGFYYGLSVEATEEKVTIDWYMTLDEDSVEKILKELEK